MAGLESGANLPGAPLRLSVVIPVRDDAVMLAGVLAALRAQTRPPDEVVVVDNGSRDGSGDVARRAGACVIVEPVAGIPRATARGFDWARGDVLLRLDADSRPPATWVARVEEHFAFDPALAALTGPGRFYGGPRLARVLGRSLYLGGYFTVVGAVLGHPPLFGSNFAVRREVWATIAASVHRDRPDVHDDLDISLALRPGMRVVHDRGLEVGISTRPFDDLRGLLRRLLWAYRTFAVNWSEQGPVRRRLAWSRSTRPRTERPAPGGPRGS
jgi:glycosyltransferase involved in cell wall biosynthesis